jgi:nucleotide-binding universal stress UspA family protein
MADEKLQEKLADYVEDAHAMEQSVLRSLDSMISTTDDYEMKSMLEHHKEETERHERLLKERLDALGEETSAPKEAQMVAAALLKGIADRARTDKPVKNARDGYVTEHMEIACYQILERLAERAGDTETAEVAGRNRADEEEMARKIDSSEEANLAATTAADLAQKTGSELHIVNVKPAPVDIEPTSEIAYWMSNIEESERKEAQQFLDAQTEQIKALGATVAQTHVRLGRPDEEIVILAEEIGAGLIAIGSRGLGGMRRALMGSVSDSVVRHASCPVLVVRAEKGSRHYLEGSDSAARRPWRGPERRPPRTGLNGSWEGRCAP